MNLLYRGTAIRGGIASGGEIGSFKNTENFMTQSNLSNPISTLMTVGKRSLFQKCVFFLFSTTWYKTEKLPKNHSKSLHTNPVFFYHNKIKIVFFFDIVDCIGLYINCVDENSSKKKKKNLQDTFSI